jgi:hypothetical protein
MAKLVRRGSDINVLVTINDADSNPVNIDNLSDLFVYVVLASRPRGSEVLAKFNKAGGGGFLALDKITTTQYRAKVLSGTTKTAYLGLYDLDVNIVETDAEYESSEENTVVVQEIFELGESTSKSQSSG